MVRKIRRIKRTLRILCDDLVYTDEDGEEFNPRVGQWVEVRKKTSGQDYATMLKLGALGGDDEMSAAQMEEMVAMLPEMYALLAHKITSWNWTDLWSDDNKPLPSPTAEIVGDLDFETDLIHLIEIVVGAEETPKN